MSMEDFHDQLLAKGVISVLWTQFLMQTHQNYPSSEAQELTPTIDAISELFRSIVHGDFTHADTHAHLAVESYCGHLPLGKSYFCDFFWRLWDVEFVQTIFWTS